MFYNIVEIEELSERLNSGDIIKLLTYLNRAHDLQGILTKAGLLALTRAPQSSYETYTKGCIVILGASAVKEEILMAICENAGISKNRVEVCLEYDKLQKYDISKFYYKPEYRVIFVGPMPHSAKGKKGSSSIIAEMENKQGYPRVIRLDQNGELKITKSNFKKAIWELINEDYIAIG